MRFATGAAAFLLALAVAAGCAGVPPGGAPGAPGCLLSPGPDEPVARTASPTLVLPGAVSPELPATGAIGASDPSATFLAAHLRATLLRRDCSGRLLPGVAERWIRRDGGRVWELELRGDARRADGAPLQAADVLFAWATGTAPGDSRLGAPFLLVTGLPRDSATAIGPRRLRVALRSRTEVPPAWLTAPELALSGVRLPSRAGTPGTWRAEDAGAGVLRLHPPEGVSGPTWRVLGSAGADARDLIDSGVELLLTAEPDVVDYAAGPGGRRVVPLPPGEAVLLLVPRGAWTGAPPDALDELREGLAREAVPVLARPAPVDGPWSDLHCGRTVPPGSRPGGDTGRIVYRSGDVAARAVAERLVALAAAESGRGPSLAASLPALAGRRLRAVGLGASSLEAALSRGGEAAYVVTTTADPAFLCGSVRLLEMRAPWLRISSTDARATAARLVPLIETRLAAAFRDGAVPVALGPDGLPRLLPAGAVP